MKVWKRPCSEPTCNKEATRSVTVKFGNIILIAEVCEDHAQPDFKKNRRKGERRK